MLEEKSRLLATAAEDCLNFSRPFCGSPVWFAAYVIVGLLLAAVIRTLACEGLWMVTRNNDVAVVKFGQIVGTVCAA